MFRFGRKPRCLFTHIISWLNNSVITNHWSFEVRFFNGHGTKKIVIPQNYITLQISLLNLFKRLSKILFTRFLVCLLCCQRVESVNIHMKTPDCFIGRHHCLPRHLSHKVKFFLIFKNNFCCRGDEIKFRKLRRRVSKIGFSPKLKVRWTSKIGIDEVGKLSFTTQLQNRRTHSAISY